MKFFKATHRENGSVIEFDLGDLYFIKYAYPENISLNLKHNNFNLVETEGTVIFMDRWLKDYKLEFNFKGEYYPYE